MVGTKSSAQQRDVGLNVRQSPCIAPWTEEVCYEDGAGGDEELPALALSLNGQLRGGKTLLSTCRLPLNTGHGPISDESMNRNPRS